MGDTAVDFFLETLKQLITGSKLNSILDEKHQLESLEEEIKYLRGFLKTTEKIRKEYSELMELVMQIRSVVSEAEDILDLFVINSFKLDNPSLDLESVKKEIKDLMAEVKQIYNENMYDINGAAVNKLKHSPIGSGDAPSKGHYGAMPSGYTVRPQGYCAMPSGYSTVPPPGYSASPQAYGAPLKGPYSAPPPTYGVPLQGPYVAPRPIYVAPPPTCPCLRNDQWHAQNPHPKKTESDCEQFWTACCGALLFCCIMDAIF